MVGGKPRFFRFQLGNYPTSYLPKFMEEKNEYGETSQIIRQAFSELGQSATNDEIVKYCNERGNFKENSVRSMASKMRFRDGKYKPTTAEAIRTIRKAVNILGGDIDKALEQLSEIEKCLKVIGGYAKLKELIEAMR